MNATWSFIVNLVINVLSALLNHTPKEVIPPKE